MLNAWAVGSVISLAAIAVLYHSYSIKGQFFPTCVHLLKSNLSVTVPNFSICAPYTVLGSCGIYPVSFLGSGRHC